MISRKVLEHCGCTPELLRKIHTSRASASDDDSEETKALIKYRKKTEDDILTRFSAGFETSAKSSNIAQAVDIAMDGTPIQDQTIPLMLWAQGKIDKSKFLQYFDGKTQLATEFISRTKNETGPDTISINIPRLHEIQINLIRSYLTRRLATQSARFSNLWPYFTFNPRGTDDVAKLRGDALSQRVDTIADQYNYRHFFPQTFRHQFMYGRSVVFLRSAWDRVYGWKFKDENVPAKELELESYIEREGIDYVAPHFSRVFRDTSAPLPNVNTDTGPCFIGYWDIIRWQAIQDGEFFNRDKVTFGESTSQLLQKYSPYFSYYFDACVLKWPDCKTDPTEGNDRTRNVGTYSINDRDKGCLVAQYFVKINPKHEKIATYNGDVWIRYSVAGDNTVIGGEFLTNTPACYGGYNENDDRLVNPSMATELMGFQDQLSNLHTQLLTTIRTGMMQIWAVDKDALEPEVIKYIEKTMKSSELYTEPHMLQYSGKILADLQLQNPSMNPRSMLTIIQAQVLTSIDQIYRAIGEVFQAADKMVMMSPNEQAQPNPREVAAREVTEISSSTSAISSFVSDGIDEQFAAIKKQLFASLICESTTTFRVPVINRYTKATIEAAGFQLQGGGDINDPNEIVPLTSSIIGTPKNLIYEYYFDSRDGAERPINTQGAQVLSTFFGQMAQSPELMGMLGKRRIFEMLNEIMRLSGAAYDLRLDSNEQDNQPGLEEKVNALAAQLQQIMQQLGATLPPAGGAPAAPGAPAPPAPPPPQGTGAAPAPAADEGTAPEQLPAGLRSG